MWINFIELLSFSLIKNSNGRSILGPMTAREWSTIHDHHWTSTLWAQPTNLKLSGRYPNTGIFLTYPWSMVPINEPLQPKEKLLLEWRRRAKVLVLYCCYRSNKSPCIFGIMRLTAGKSNSLKPIALYRRTAVRNKTKDSVQKETNLK